MGLDLALLPDRWPKLEVIGWTALAYDRLALLRDYELFERIKKVPTTPVPMIQNYEDEGIRNRTTDPYGDPLTRCTAGALSEIPEPKGLHPWNRAVMAFVRALPGNTPIVLWWH